MYPYRLSFLNNNDCVVCNNIKANSQIMFGETFKGWDICNNLNCKNKVLEWKSKLIMSKKDLIEELGDNIFVKRNTGQYDSGWEICSDAIKDSKDDILWVKLIHKYLKIKKEVKLHELKEWNMKR